MDALSRFYVEPVASHTVNIPEMDYLTIPVKPADSPVDLFLFDPDPFSQLFQRHRPLVELHSDMLNKPLGQRLAHINSRLEAI